ncbi:hypothetical protein EV190_104267 [Actinorugispora endophytica]|uniref:Uncharacterized protein n=1 Tax=Actinorugispora endophytica TaxID=1605990 RepID=A0A4R6V594_9ACTN|nr:hypothetical protein EV190_104267 [Actinorugispora endophytica]
MDPEDLGELAEAVVEGDAEEMVEETLEVIFGIDL